MIIASVPMGCGAHVFHVVERGETLYSIGWMYGYDYHTLAEWNQIQAPYTLRVGQRLRVNPMSHAQPAWAGADKKHITETDVSTKGHWVKTDKRIKYNAEVYKSGEELKQTKQQVSQQSVNNVNYSVKNSVKASVENTIQWLWPTRSGRIVNTFKAGNPGERGLDIVGTEGQSVYSASSGRVVYSGSGLPRYGKLIIVKHNDMFLSAYAHNKELLVKEGDEVGNGQQIAVMGNTGSQNRSRLHFEIRHHGKPVDPLLFLPTPIPKQFN
ncbi:MAG: peptidoglycan DD-metalloendopeptidase family protein [Gammaproteobacteria bacterium]|nr:peptidoglycan DD-metalloendopeptidase family protein [Gammaproteobacteria bacterium]MDH5803351.1 peptidoglycan DD-metalloendopeptidase family protein [Gammaproteobacteria bacterium]